MYQRNEKAIKTTALFLFEVLGSIRFGVHKIVVYCISPSVCVSVLQMR